MLAVQSKDRAFGPNWPDLAKPGADDINSSTSDDGRKRALSRFRA